MDMCTWRGLTVVGRLGYSIRETLPNDCSCPSRTACCVVVACLPYTLTSCNQGRRMVSEMWLCCYRACCDVWGHDGQTQVENCDVQFCWWETVSLCFSMSGTVIQKKKMNPCKNYLSTSFSFSLACMLELSDLGQIKDQWFFFLRGKHLCPLSLQGQNSTGLVQI